MAKRGPKPKPAVLHLLNGNPSKINLEKRMESELKVNAIDPSDLPQPPAWMETDQIACETWHHLIKELSALKIVTALDLQTLEMLCKSYSRWRQAEQQIEDAKTFIMETGKDRSYKQQIPQISVAKGYFKQYKDLMSEFGLSPSSRVGLKQNLDDVNVMDDSFRGLL